MSHQVPSLFDWKIAGPAIGESFKKLDPRLMIRNPVMFVTLVGAVLTTVSIFTAPVDRFFIVQLAIWLWFTVLFANFAEAMAEGRGKAQADSLRKARKDTVARRVRSGKEERVPAPELQKGDVVVCDAGDVIPADGEVIEALPAWMRPRSLASLPRSFVKAAVIAALSPAAHGSSVTASSSGSHRKRATPSWIA